MSQQWATSHICKRNRDGPFRNQRKRHGYGPSWHFGNVTAMGVLGTSTVVTDMGLLGTTANVANMATLGASGVTANMATISNNISNVNTLATTLSGTQTFAVTVAGGVFVIDGANKPALTLVRGFTYTFDVSDSSNSGHPLQFKNGSSSYTTGVTVNGTAGQTGATVVFAVPSNAPATGLLYYCTVHGNSMGNSIATQNNDIASVVAISSDITSVANIHPDVTQVAGMNTNITNVLNNATNINTVANNIADVNSFANTYFIGTSAPTGGTVGAGDLWYDSGTNNLKIYNGSAWVTFIANYTTDNLTEGSTNQYYTNGRVETYLDGGASTPVFASGTVSGAWNVNSLTGPATFVIDPAAIGDDTGTVQIKGSLQVDGTTTTVNSATLSVADKNITVANGAATQAQPTARPYSRRCQRNANLRLGQRHIRFQQKRHGSRLNINHGRRGHRARHRARLVGEANGKHIQERAPRSGWDKLHISLHGIERHHRDPWHVTLQRHHRHNSCQRSDARRRQRLKRSTYAP